MNFRILALLVFLLAAPGIQAADGTSAACLNCHDGSKTLQATGEDGKKRELKPVHKSALARSTHTYLECNDCHKDVVDNQTPHKKTGVAPPDCVSCHQNLWEQLKKDGRDASRPDVKLVLDQAEAYKRSVHSKPNTDEPDKANATCAGCHNAHAFRRIPKEGPERTAWRLGVPAACGTCHDTQLEDYQGSVHGAKIAKGDAKAAICADCHNPHGVDRMSQPSAKLHTTQACIGCHQERGKSYTDTYHGQVTALGYTNTAQCFSCHDNHAVKKLDDPTSKIHLNNRLETCQKCHKQATAGFVSFQPHATSHDFERYPQVWLATKFMAGLLLGTFAFFWVHLLMWLYREIQDRRHGKRAPHVDVSSLGLPPGKAVHRFNAWWRLGHLLFAVSLMLLTLTGMTLMYAGSEWAPVVVRALGGPKVAGLIHRVSAIVFSAIFVIHLVYIVVYLVRNWRTFRIFGPDSLIPNLQDLKDVVAMFKWFVGRGPRPIFDRWTYWEKFDYWAPFWGVTIVGVSGFMMWFPEATAKVLPGWVFNVATIAHGEEAFLAAVFLFTVHFFNNHFRPDKFPFDPVMFTGSMPIEHFAREHGVQYRRLVENGELHKHLVDAPSRPMTLASHALGFFLIGCGLVLLVLIGKGFLRSMGA
ncbi:cytochrome c3 family protein [Aquabacterium humicola]|uniref:cytochrome c3 family protein n=1 Tax=Aquabacterium humicola TaxID=3237377 RepID=UPI0025434431|nr:cytochrome c3 family protein [Rubrivivax pictus]